MKVQSYTTITHSVSIHLFGKYFTFNTAKKFKKKDVLSNLDLFAQKIVNYIAEARWEYDRSDDKKVILLYEKASNGLSFCFAVEADDELKLLMKDSQEKIHEIREYIIKNYPKLNFDI